VEEEHSTKRPLFRPSNSRDKNRQKVFEAKKSTTELSVEAESQPPVEVVTRKSPSRGGGGVLSPDDRRLLLKKLFG